VLLHTRIDEPRGWSAKILPRRIVGEEQLARDPEGPHPLVAGQRQRQTGDVVLAIRQAELQQVDDVRALAQAYAGRLASGKPSGSSQRSQSRSSPGR
jgi:hypothetical protein